MGHVQMRPFSRQRMHVAAPKRRCPNSEVLAVRGALTSVAFFRLLRFNSRHQQVALT